MSETKSIAGQALRDGEGIAAYATEQQSIQDIRDAFDNMMDTLFPPPCFYCDPEQLWKCSEAGDECTRYTAYLLADAGCQSELPPAGTEMKNSPERDKDIMMIKVLYTDFHYDYVNRAELGRLIENRQIAGFFRSSGWATLGVDPIRDKARSTVTVMNERRKFNQESE